jgi:rubrerythrin
MTVYEFAQQMEKDGEKYYRTIAEKEVHFGLKVVLNRLADDELKHYQLILAMSNGDLRPFHRTTILETAKNIFKIVQEKKENLSQSLSQIDIYSHGKEIEVQSEAFYLAKSRETDNPAERDLFIQLAGEEKKHLILLENIIEFISRPDTWVENAEFHQQEEY